MASHCDPVAHQERRPLDGTADLTGRHQITFIWVKGLVESPESCRCNELAVLAQQADDLPPDKEFENLLRKPNPPQQMDLLGLFQ